ncbi:MAG: class I SAM-dependent methyltransferase [Phycisphaerales bacterium]
MDGSTGETVGGAGRCSFEALRDGYNFRTTPTRARVLTDLLLEQIERLERRRVLDIGCGRGIQRNASLMHEVASASDEFWGIEPDPSIEPDPVITNFQHATMESAELPAGYFDLSFSSMVVEHVADPDAYLAAIARCTAPGGWHMFSTVNGLNHFALLTKMSATLGVEDALLRLLRGKSTTDSYHYPTTYRMNKPSQLRELARRHGFEEPEFVFIEPGRGGGGYYPGPLKLFYGAVQVKRRLIRRPDRLITLICRMRRRPG